MRNKKWIVIITAIISVLVVAIAITSVFLLSPSASYTRSIQEAENLVEEGDYENAILAYQEAIEKDPDNVEAYLGLANVYEKSGELSLAIQTLETGYRRTKSAQIKVLLNRMVETEETGNGSQTLAFNQELLDMFSTYKEEDYEEIYGRSDGRRDARFEGLDAQIRFDEDSIPTEIHLDDILTLFDTNKPIPVEELDEMLSGNYRTTSSASHGEMVVFESNSTEVTIALVNDAVTSDSYNTLVPLTIEKEVEEEEEQEVEEKSPTVLVTGRTVDEESNATIASVTITVYQGTSITGAVVTTTTSDGNGYFSLTLERSGDFYLVLDKDMYHGETSISVTEESADEENIGMIHLEKTDYEIQAILEYTKGEITLEAALGMDGADPMRGTAGGNVLHHPTTGAVTAIREVTESGNQVRDVITIYDRNLPWLYTVIRRSGSAPIASANAMVTIRDRGKDDVVMSPDADNPSPVWQPFIAWRGDVRYVDLYN